MKQIILAPADNVCSGISRCAGHLPEQGNRQEWQVLARAALKSFVTKCKVDACRSKRSTEWKAARRRRKASFMKKCERSLVTARTGSKLTKQ